MEHEEIGAVVKYGSYHAEKSKENNLGKQATIGQKSRAAILQ
ncbi:hypothetical protein [Paenibacillus albidus]|nr:hypothetical protein [Paenibacillus albidus]